MRSFVTQAVVLALLWTLSTQLSVEAVNQELYTGIRNDDNVSGTDKSSRVTHGRHLLAVGAHAEYTNAIYYKVLRHAAWAVESFTRAVRVPGTFSLGRPVFLVGKTRLCQKETTLLRKPSWSTIEELVGQAVDDTDTYYGRYSTEKTCFVQANTDGTETWDPASTSVIQPCLTYDGTGTTCAALSGEVAYAAWSVDATVSSSMNTNTLFKSAMHKAYALMSQVRDGDQLAKALGDGLAGASDVPNQNNAIAAVHTALTTTQDLLKTQLLVATLMVKQQLDSADTDMSTTGDELIALGVGFIATVTGTDLKSKMVDALSAVKTAMGTLFAKVTQLGSLTPADLTALKAIPATIVTAISDAEGKAQTFLENVSYTDTNNHFEPMQKLMESMQLLVGSAMMVATLTNMMVLSETQRQLVANKCDRDNTAASADCTANGWSYSAYNTWLGSSIEGAVGAFVGGVSAKLGSLAGGSSLHELHCWKDSFTQRSTALVYLTSTVGSFGYAHQAWQDDIIKIATYNMDDVAICRDIHARHATLQFESVIKSGTCVADNAAQLQCTVKHKDQVTSTDLKPGIHMASEADGGSMSFSGENFVLSLSDPTVSRRRLLRNLLSIKETSDTILDDDDIPEPVTDEDRLQSYPQDAPSIHSRKLLHHDCFTLFEAFAWICYATAGQYCESASVCTATPAGKWSSDSSSTAFDCNTKPATASWYQLGSTVADCPWTCNNGGEYKTGASNVYTGTTCAPVEVGYYSPANDNVQYACTISASKIAPYYRFTSAGGATPTGCSHANQHQVIMSPASNVAFDTAYTLKDGYTAEMWFDITGSLAGTTEWGLMGLQGVWYLYITIQNDLTSTVSLKTINQGTAGSSTVTSSTFTWPNTMTHIAIQITSNTVIFYINGKQKGASPFTAPVWTTTNPSYLYLGGEEPVNKLLVGKVDEVRIHSTSVEVPFLGYTFPDRYYSKSCDPRIEKICGAEACHAKCTGGYISEVDCSCTCPTGYEVCKGTCVPKCPNNLVRDEYCKCQCDSGEYMAWKFRYLTIASPTESDHADNYFTGNTAKLIGLAEVNAFDPSGNKLTPAACTDSGHTGSNDCAKLYDNIVTNAGAGMWLGNQVGYSYVTLDFGSAVEIERVYVFNWNDGTNKGMKQIKLYGHDTVGDRLKYPITAATTLSQLDGSKAQLTRTDATKLASRTASASTFDPVLVCKVCSSDVSSVVSVLPRTSVSECACLANWQRSHHECLQKLTATAPLSPAGGDVAIGQTVTTSYTPPGIADPVYDTAVEVRFTLDGSDPTSGSTLYAGAIPLANLAITTVKMIVVQSGRISGDITSATYTTKGTLAVTPSATTSNFHDPLSVTMTCAQTPTSANVKTVHYTTDGTTPTTSSPSTTAPIDVPLKQDGTAVVIVKALCVSPFYTDSPVVSETFTQITKVSTPIIAPSGTTFSHEVTLTATTFITSDMQAKIDTDAYAPYPSGGVQLTCTDPTVVTCTRTVKFKATKATWTDSDEVTATITINIDAPNAPTISQSEAGTTVKVGTTLTVSTGYTDTRIEARYTLDGTDPTLSSPLYSAPIALTPGTVDFRVRNFRTAGATELSSAVTKLELTVTDHVLSTPVISPGAGQFVSSPTISITCSGTGASAHYTLTGGVPSASSPKYETGIELASTTTIKAVCLDGSGGDSAIITAVYTVSASLFTIATTPTVSPATGTYQSPLAVALAHPFQDPKSTLEIRYSFIDGQPVSSSSFKYSGSLTLPGLGDITLRARIYQWNADRTVVVNEGAEMSVKYTLTAAPVKPPSTTGPTSPSTSSGTGDSGVTSGASNSTASAAGLVLSVPRSTTSEMGADASVFVQLRAAPLADTQVFVTAKSTDKTEGTVTPTALTFTATTYSIAQAFRVTGVDDVLADSDVSYNIILTNNHTRISTMVPFTNLDNETPGMDFSQESLSCETDETGKGVAFTVNLKSRPNTTLSWVVTSNNTKEETVSVDASSTNIVTFDNATWSKPQTIRVIGVRDSVSDRDQPVTVSISPANSQQRAQGKATDPRYANMTRVVSCTNRNIEWPVISGITPTTLSPQSNMSITVTGSNFVTNAGVNAQPQVFIADILLRTVSVSATEIVVNYTGDFGNATQAARNITTDSNQTTSLLQFNYPEHHRLFLFQEAATDSTTGFLLGYAEVKVLNPGGGFYALADGIYIAGRCPDAGQYLNSNNECEDCPAHMNCPGGARAFPQDGYAAGAGGTGAIAQCVPASACEGGENGGCATGYTSEFCAHCADDHFKQGDKCVPCGSTGQKFLRAATSLITVAFLVVGFLTVALACQDSTFTDVIDSVNILQLVQSVSYMGHENRPFFISTFYQYLSIVALDYGGIQIGCRGTSTFVVGYVVNLGLALTISAISIAVFQLVGWITQRKIVKSVDPHTLGRGETLQAQQARDFGSNKRQWYHYRLVRVIFIIPFLLYLNITTYAMKAVHCVRVGDKSLLAADLSQQCYQGSHLPIAIISWVILICYSAGFPIGCALYLLRFRHALRQRRRKACFGFLYEELRKNAYLFAIAGLFLELCLIVCNVVLQSKRTIQFAVVVALLGVYILFVLTRRPYKKKWENYLAAIAATVAVLGKLLDLLLERGTSATMISGFAWSIFAGSVLVVLGAVAMVVWTVKHNLEKQGNKSKRSNSKVQVFTNYESDSTSSDELPIIQKARQSPREQITVPGGERALPSMVDRITTDEEGGSTDEDYIIQPVRDHSLFRPRVSTAALEDVLQLAEGVDKKDVDAIEGAAVVVPIGQQRRKSLSPLPPVSARSLTSEAESLMQVRSIDNRSPVLPHITPVASPLPSPRALVSQAPGPSHDETLQEEGTKSLQYDDTNQDEWEVRMDMHMATLESAS